MGYSDSTAYWVNIFLEITLTRADATIVFIPVG
jgi:hypothetical protein